MSAVKKVLVMEDEKPLAHALELKLTKEGHDVTVVNDGQHGLDLLLRSSFDIVLLDLMMPVLNGFQVLEKLRSAGKKPAVIVLSNLTQPEDESRVLELGARKFMVKSDTPLADIIHEVNQV